MKVLFTLTAYPPSIGGAQLLMHQLARHLAPRHDVRVATQWDAHRTDWLLGTTLRAPGPLDYAIDGIPVSRIAPTGRARLAPWVAAYWLLQGAAIRRFAGALGPSLEPLVAGADLVHNCRIGREGLSYASLEAARRHHLPFVLTPVHHPRWGGWLHRHYHRLYREADAVIALTTVERDVLVSLGVDARRVFVTGMGPVLADSHDGPRFRASHGLGHDPLVLFLGQKYAYKGAAAVLQAATSVWARFPEVRFVFLGPRTRHSRRVFARVQDPRVLELDAVDLQQKTDALAACDALCVPSLQESFGGVFTEAWALGKPVIAGDIPSVRSVVEEGRDGFLVPQRPGPIAERLCVLLADPDLGRQMGRRGRAKVEAELTWPRLAEKTEGAYQATLGR